MLNSLRRAAQRKLDSQLQEFRAVPNPPLKGWVRAIRDAIGMTGQQFANRLQVAWQSMDDLEKSEAAGTITLNSLRRAAAALDCRLVYALVPLNGTLEEMVEARAQQIARAALARIGQTMLLEDQAVASSTLEERVQDYVATHLRDRDLWAAGDP